MADIVGRVRLASMAAIAVAPAALGVLGCHRERGRRKERRKLRERVRREVRCCDAIVWLENLGVHGLDPGTVVVTTLPDWGEVLTETEFVTEMEDTLQDFPIYDSWFRKAAKLVLTRAPPSSFVIFYQNDAQVEGVWLDQSLAIAAAAEEVGAALLWHKIAINERMVGVARQGCRASYVHVLCYLTPKLPRGCSGHRLSKDAGMVMSTAGMSTALLADVLPCGKTVYPAGMGVAALCHVYRWLGKTDAPSGEPLGLIVDPFCGHGTALALANFMGVDALGVDLDASCCRTAKRLEVDGLVPTSARPVAAVHSSAQARRHPEDADDAGRASGDEYRPPRRPSPAAKGQRVPAPTPFWLAD